MTFEQFDVVVLGTGPAGSTVARKAAAAGHRTAIVEAREFGGTCALRGCNPKKVYANAGDLIDRVRRADGKLIRGKDVSIDWNQLLQFKNEFTNSIPDRSERSFQDDGITTVHGAAQFVSKKSLRVGERTLSAERIVVATGARPATLPFDGSEHAVQSDEFLALKSLPDKVVFIGGGYISMEFAHVVARAGSRVIIAEREDRVLESFDAKLVEMLQEESRSIGIEFEFCTEVECIEKVDANCYRVSLSNGESIDCGLVVHGAGRVPNVDELDLKAGNVQSGEKGIAVDRHLRSPSNPHVFALGDCADSGVPPLTPSANEEARIVAKNLFADEPEAVPDYGVIPHVAFTTPCIASVGMTVEQAEEGGRKCEVLFKDTSDWNSVRKLGGGVAGFRIIVDQESDRLLGAHLLGPAAEETINLFALAIKFDLTATDLKSTLFAFPTFASDVRQMV
ncbi:MAG: NAD(P)/FAD-dependent oxidoreductase [Fuerstiella sp.]